jgi:hypothetical protein
MRLLSVLAAGSQLLARRLFVGAALAFACALSGTNGLGFVTYALFEALRLQYGVVNASIGLGAIYLIVAGISLPLLSPCRADACRQRVLWADPRAPRQR